jgi:hypothetical protein
MLNLLLIIPLLGLGLIYIQSIGFNFSVFSELFNEITMYQLLLSSMLPIKPLRLTKKEPEAFSLPDDLKEILALARNIVISRKGKIY